MNDLFEFFFCPIHGIFRPDIIIPMYQSAYCYLLAASAYARKVFGA